MAKVSVLFLVTLLEHFEVFEKFADLLPIGAVIKAPDAAFLVHKDEIFGVDHVVGSAIPIGLYGQIGFSGQLVDLFFFTRHQVPFAVHHAFFQGIFFQLGNGVDHRSHRMREQHHLGIVKDRVLDLGHVLRHDGANGGAGGEKEIRHVNLVLVIFLGDGLPVLVDQGKVGNGVVFFLVVQGAVHQRGVHHRRLIHREHFLGLERVVEQKDDYCGKPQQNQAEKLVFGKE